jgi:hypothetical protein
MDAKDIITLVGIGITFIVSLASLIIGLRNNDRTSFVNSITSSRIKWIDNLRCNISEFCGLTYHYAITPLGEKEKNELREKVDRLRFLIKLQLNRSDTLDKEIIHKIDVIPVYTDSPDLGKLEAELNLLIIITQDLLKFEWERVKAESKSGELSAKSKKLLEAKFRGSL